MSDVRLLVNGKKHGGWKRIQITRAIDSIAGSFAMEISDRWRGQNDPWPIGEEDACRVEIDGDRVIEGFVDSRNPAGNSGDRGLSVAGRDRSAALVDNSAMLAKWTFRNASVVKIAKTMCKPFEIAVAMQPGIILPKAPAKTVVSPGDSAWSVIEHAAQLAGVLVISDGAGGILLTRAGTKKAEALIEGKNIKEASAEYNAIERFYRYVILAQAAGTDEANGAQTRIRAEAFDLGVRRKNRVCVVRLDHGCTIEYAKRRANWEANVRRARAQPVTIQVHGWRQTSTKELWPINALVYVQAPILIGVRGTMLITKTDFSLTDAGETTTLTLMDPHAFEPEPSQSKTKPDGTWKELAGGAR